MLRVRISPRPSASNLEQAANLLCAQANSASYPQWDGKWVVAYGLQGEGLVWYVCVLHRSSNSSPSRAMDGRIMPHCIISSCQSAATSEIVKRCCSSLVSSVITSTQTFYLFTRTFQVLELSRKNPGLSRRSGNPVILFETSLPC